MTPASMPVLLRAHALLASFFLPVGVMFMITGALYTLEIKGDYRTEKHDLPLEAPLTADLDALGALSAAFLNEQGIAEPTGAMSIRSVGTSFAFEWTGSNRDLILQPTGEPLVASLQVKDTTFHRRLVQLHKAKGGPAFKALAVASATGILFLFASGAAMAWRDRVLRKPAIIAAACGIAAFVVIALLS